MEYAEGHHRFARLAFRRGDVEATGHGCEASSGLGYRHYMIRQTAVTTPHGGPTAEEISKAPKALLHDHLDGGLRPSTIVELAADVGHDLPTKDPDELRAWIQEAANSGSLERYLETFVHTVSVMQTREALVRVAAECAEDLAADGVVYAEVRYAPEQHLDTGLSLEQVVEAVEEGFRLGEDRAAEAGHQIRIATLLTAMRHNARSTEIAELAVRYRDAGVVGFDIAGAEAGFPPTRHLDAFEYLRRENFRFTIHAGEGFGLPSIWEALQWCGAHRLGHGVRIIDDITIGGSGAVELGRLAAYVRDIRVPLEMCPSSNVQTGAAPSIEEHPFGLLARLRFRVTVNTDNRLMSGTSMSRELSLLSAAFGYDLDDFQWFAVNAMKSAFIPFDQRLAVINDVIKPRYAILREARAFTTLRGPHG
jgi:adenosine deaminase